jgi:hypothetical protein
MRVCVCVCAWVRACMCAQLLYHASPFEEYRSLCWQHWSRAGAQSDLLAGTQLNMLRARLLHFARRTVKPPIHTMPPDRIEDEGWKTMWLAMLCTLHDNQVHPRLTCTEREQPIPAQVPVLLRSAWHMDPRQRPTAEQLLAALAGMVKAQVAHSSATSPLKSGLVSYDQEV